METENKYLNVWKDNKFNLAFETLNNCVFKIGNGKIFKQSENHYYYTIDNIMVNQLAGLNKKHLISLIENLDSKDQNNDFLFNMAKENYKRGLKLLKKQKQSLT